MIPQRVTMSGFLSYKDKQTIEFSTSPLWMLAGSNGSGKSSVFDALTYALFGHHRGGSQNAAELINKESNDLLVEFDFRLDGKLYRVKRTLRRNSRGAISGTQQLFEHDSDDWRAVPDTTKKVDFDRWVHDKIGLTYETFTSSVLLLQGKAEKLLDARPSGRAEVLAGIVDLERFQRLHEKANTRKLELKSKIEALSHQHAAVPEVSDLEYVTAQAKIEEAEEACNRAHAEIDALVETEAAARRWADAQGRFTTAEAKLRHAELVLADAVKIEKQFARLTELRAVLPAANTVITMRGQFTESQENTKRYLKQREDALERKRQAEHNLEQARLKQDSQRKLLAEDEGKLAKTNSRLRELAGLMEKVRLVENAETTLRDLTDELSRLPADPEADCVTAQRELDRLHELNRGLPNLEMFQTERSDLAAANAAEKTAQEELLRIKDEGEVAKAESARARTEAERARQVRSAADEAAAVAKSQADRASESLREFIALKGAANCHACGQPLTAEHFEQEKARREEEAQATADHLLLAEKAREAAAQRERELTEAADLLQKRVENLRDAYRDHQTHAKQAAADIHRLTQSLGLRYADLPEPYRGRVSPGPVPDWTRTTFPERDELTTLRRESAGLDGARRALQSAQETLRKWRELRAKAETTAATRDNLRKGMPQADPVALREEHCRLQSDESALTNAIRAAKNALHAIEAELHVLGREEHAALQELTDLEGRLRTEEVTRRHSQDSAERAMKDLPDDWRMPVQAAGFTEYHQWRGELDELLASGVEGRFRQLEVARGGLASLREEVAALRAEAEAFPPEARRPTQEVRQLLTQARQSLSDRDRELREAQKRKDMLDGYREQRAMLGEQFRHADAAHNRYKLLSELLGRDRLQRHLVRQAERQIVDYANAVLDRLSGGQLFLRLVGEDGAGADRALELECANRVTGGAPINVAFLSGSQRFRVAVSLALAIGQYASKQHRPIESVIIDEGFGCLDRQGRQVMIQELQNLRGHLHCILLVSHQEEFADAFADGYRFELQDGATRISRFAK